MNGFLAQGSENGFGKKYAHGINDKALTEGDQFIQIVSCNTHNLSCITDTLAVNHDPDNLIRTQDLDPIYEENSCHGREQSLEYLLEIGKIYHQNHCRHQSASSSIQAVSVDLSK